MKILVVDSFPGVGSLLKKHLEMEQDRQQAVVLVRTATEKPTTIIDIELNYEQAKSTLADEHAYDVVIIDPRPQETPELGIEIVQQLEGTRIITIAIVTTERVHDCVACMRAGAWDYIRKGTNMGALAQLLLASIAYAFEKRTPKADEDAAFLERSFESLALEHPDQWVAIGNGKFLGAADTYSALRDKIAAIPIAAPKFWRMPPRWPEGDR